MTVQGDEGPSWVVPLTGSFCVCGKGVNGAALRNHITRLLETGSGATCTGIRKGTFYAAFELRCGIEARMRQYLRAREDVSDKKAKGWQLNRLARDIEAAFRTGNKFIRMGIRQGQ
jgi:hypothetical protein